MNNKEALQRVQSITHIPEHYQLTIEDFKEGKFLFCWKDPEEDKGIVTEFNDNGNLVYFTKDEELGNGENFSKKERERIALRFINDHTSASLADFSYHTQTQHGDHLRLTYRQQQMNLPLPKTGLVVVVASNGEVLEFRDNGKKRLPPIPNSILPKERLRRWIENKLKLNLQLVFLGQDGYYAGDDRFHLVYEPNSVIHQYYPVECEPSGIFPEKEDKSKPVPPIVETEPQKLTLEEFVGVDERTFQRLREIDLDDGLTGIVWKSKEDGTLDETDLTIDGFFKERTGNTVKAFVDAETGQLQSFHWFKERNGSKWLSYDDCLQHAVAFLQQRYPNEYRYFRMTGDNHNSKKKELAFHFQLYKEHVPIFLTNVVVIVNRTTGLVDTFHGLKFRMDGLDNVTTVPILSPEEAKKRMMDELELALKWDAVNDNNQEFRLVYQVSTPKHIGNLRFVDALDGRIIYSQF